MYESVRTITKEGQRSGHCIRLPQRKRAACLRATGAAPASQPLPKERTATAPPAKAPRKRPKLTADLLLSERGLGYVLEHFPKRVLIKGKGHEAGDLHRLLHQYLQWQLHVFPSLSFPEFTEKLERLGATRRLRACLRELQEKVAQASCPGNGDQHAAMAPEPDSEACGEEVFKSGNDCQIDKQPKGTFVAEPGSADDDLCDEQDVEDMEEFEDDVEAGVPEDMLDELYGQGLNDDASCIPCREEPKRPELDESKVRNVEHDLEAGVPRVTPDDSYRQGLANGTARISCHEQQLENTDLPSVGEAKGVASTDPLPTNHMSCKVGGDIGGNHMNFKQQAQEGNACNKPAEQAPLDLGGSATEILGRVSRASKRTCLIDQLKQSTCRSSRLQQGNLLKTSTPGTRGGPGPDEDHEEEALADASLEDDVLDANVATKGTSFSGRFRRKVVVEDDDEDEA
eukprot:SM000113S24064  [mRNA]  locus=s113:253421:255855:- [translate_table: standard]